MNKDIIKGKV